MGDTADSAAQAGRNADRNAFGSALSDYIAGLQPPQTNTELARSLTRASAKTGSDRTFSRASISKYASNTECPGADFFGAMSVAGLDVPRSLVDAWCRSKRARKGRATAEHVMTVIAEARTKARLPPLEAYTTTTTSQSPAPETNATLCPKTAEADPVRPGLLLVSLDLVGGRPASEAADKAAAADGLMSIVMRAFATITPSGEGRGKNIWARDAAIAIDGDTVAISVDLAVAPVDLLYRGKPALEEELAKYNSRHYPELQLTLRALFAVESIRATFKRVPKATMGLLQELREVLRVAAPPSPPERGIFFAATDTYYQSVVKEEARALTTGFVEIRVDTGSGTTRAWAHQGSGRPEQHTSAASKLDPSPLKQALHLTDVRRAVVIAIADVHNYNLYERNAAVPLVKHLETGLLLFKHVIVHCADPYRKPEVYAALAEYERFVRSGEILFLLGRGIQDVLKDYPTYIRRKANEYNQSSEGVADTRSLNVAEFDERVERAAQLVSQSPYLLHRNFSGTDLFHASVHNDVQSRAPFAVSHISLPALAQANLTVGQILGLCIYNGGAQMPVAVFNIDEVEKFVAALDGERILSRQIVMGRFHRLLTDGVADKIHHDTLMRLAETRVNLLHLKVNGPRHSFLEHTIERDRLSPYYHRHLTNHLSALGGRVIPEIWGPDGIEHLRANRQWWDFANYHLRTMAEVQAQRLDDVEQGPDGFFAGAEEHLDIFGKALLEWGS